VEGRRTSDNKSGSPESLTTELSNSEHKVATHVDKIMRKLGLSSRSQIAAWVADQQLSRARRFVLELVSEPLLRRDLEAKEDVLQLWVFRYLQLR
jgi:hypothetical protein